MNKKQTITTIVFILIVWVICLSINIILINHFKVLIIKQITSHPEQILYLSWLVVDPLMAINLETIIGITISLSLNINEELSRINMFFCAVVSTVIWSNAMFTIHNLTITMAIIVALIIAIVFTFTML